MAAMENQNLPTQEPTYRDALHALYIEAVAKINAVRNDLLSSAYYLKIRDAVFEACYTALQDHRSGKQRMLTVAAAPGAGKTSFSLAFIVALTQYAEQHPQAPYGVVFVTDRSARADAVYRELDALLPGNKVAVWTEEHSGLFSREALRQYPVAVVNNQFYFGKNGKHARNVNKRGQFPERALSIIDERPQQVDVFEIVLSQAQGVREKTLDKFPEIKEDLDRLLKFMEGYSYKTANRLFLPDAEVSDTLAWFNSPKAHRLAELKIDGVDQLFGFGRAVAQGCGYALTDGPLVRFVGYSPKGYISAGTVLLDATADIDGVSKIVSNRMAVEVPPAKYGNLEIICAPQHTTQNLKRYFASATNQKAYVRYVRQLVEQHMAPGQYGLVVCKQDLILHQRIPDWSDGDPRFDDPKSYTERFEWNIGGRNLCVTHWGSGIGSNAWMNADVVFLMDTFYLPRRVAGAHVHGLKGQRVHEGPLSEMKTINSKSEAIDLYNLGHILRHLKQMALRGRARCYDKDGVCGKMRLVVSCEQETFLANVKTLFPGAPARIVGTRAHSKWAERVLTALNGSTEPVVTTSQLSDLLSKEWRKIRFAVVTPEFLSALDGIGWRYVPGKGRRVGWFEHTVPNEALAA